MGASGYELNVYATPAVLTLILLLLETAFLFFALPETRGKRAQAPAPKAQTNGVHTNGAQTNGSSTATNGHTNGHANGHANGNGATKDSNGKANGNGVVSNGNGKANGHPVSQGTVEQRIKTLSVLRRLHFLFLGLFSGMEFTLTFLTFDRKSSSHPSDDFRVLTPPFPPSTVFDWNNKQNGGLIASVGIMSALLQGGYVRRAMSKIGEGRMAQRGVASCALGLTCLSLVPVAATNYPALAVNCLRAACVCLAFTSATVVNSLTAFASLQCDDGVVDEDTGKAKEEHPELAKGKALGQFRSSGQLGRATGPILGMLSSRLLRCWIDQPFVLQRACPTGPLVPRSPTL